MYKHEQYTVDGVELCVCEYAFAGWYWYFISYVPRLCFWWLWAFAVSTMVLRMSSIIAHTWISPWNICKVTTTHLMARFPEPKSAPMMIVKTSYIVKIMFVHDVFTKRICDMKYESIVRASVVYSCSTLSKLFTIIAI